MGEVKVFCTGAEAKASLNRAHLPSVSWGKSMGVDPKPKRSIQGQVEARVTPSGGPNPFMLKNVGMSSG